MFDSVNLFKKFDEIIREHGSASILKDHVIFLKEKFSSAEKEIVSLQNANNSIQLELDVSQSEIIRLNKVISSLQMTRDKEDLEKAEENILKLLFENEGYHKIEFIASFIGVDTNTAKYHVNKLVNSKLVHNLLRVNAPIKYKINKNGLKYVVDSNCN